MSRDSATTVHRTQLPTPAHAHNATPHDTRTRVKAEVPLVIGYGASGRANAWHGCCPCAHTPRMESASGQRHAVWLHQGMLPTSDMQMQAQISKRVATHARLSIQLEGTARKGNSAHTSLVVCLHRIDHVCQSAAALHVARAVCTRQGAGGERARLDKPNACRWCRRCVRTARICAHRVVLIEAVGRRKKEVQLPAITLVRSSKSGTLFSDLLSACTDSF